MMVKQAPPAQSGKTTSGNVGPYRYVDSATRVFRASMRRQDDSLHRSHLRLRMEESTCARRVGYYHWQI